MLMPAITAIQSMREKTSNFRRARFLSLAHESQWRVKGLKIVLKHFGKWMWVQENVLLQIISLQVTQSQASFSDSADVDKLDACQHLLLLLLASSFVQ